MMNEREQEWFLDAVEMIMILSSRAYGTAPSEVVILLERGQKILATEKVPACITISA